MPAMGGSSWKQRAWPNSWKDYHINILELYPIVAMVETIGHNFNNSVICFHCDKSSVVDIFKQTILPKMRL